MGCKSFSLVSVSFHTIMISMIPTCSYLDMTSLAWNGSIVIGSFSRAMGQTRTVHKIDKDPNQHMNI